MIYLDFPAFEDVNTFQKTRIICKNRMEFITAVGPEIVRTSRVDPVYSLILMISPNTVQAVLGTRVDMVTVHAAGGVEMMTAVKGQVGIRTSTN